MNRKQKKYHLKIPGKACNLETIRNFVSDIAVEMGFNPENVNKIELAVDEACTNIIEHAYGHDENQDIDVSVQSDMKKLTVIVSDKGKSFDHKNIEMPDMKKYLEELRVGGLGIYLMKTLMDDVKYSTSPGGRNEVRMVKYLAETKTSEK